MLALVPACATDPGDDDKSASSNDAAVASTSEPVGEPTEREQYLAWIAEWSEEASGFTGTYFGVTKELSNVSGELTIEAIHEVGRKFETAASELAAGLERAGSLDSTMAAATYDDALTWATDQVLEFSSSMRTCAAAACATGMDDVLTSGRVLSDLAIKTAGVRLEESGVTRTVRIADAVFTAEALDGKPLTDVIVPATDLCKPSFEGGDALDALEQPVASEGAAVLLQSQVTFQSLQQWDTPAPAFQYFETLDVRAATCPLEELDLGGGSIKQWSSELAPLDLSVHAVSWRSVRHQGDQTFYGLGVGALVDDTVVTILLIGAESPAANDGKALLRLAVERLGVDPERISGTG